MDFKRDLATLNETCGKTDKPEPSMVDPAMLIQLQCTIGDFDASFVKRLGELENVMLMKGLEPSAFVISKDRVQFTELPTFVRPGGDGFNYTVFINGASFAVTKANDMAFLDYFEQLCASAAEESATGLPESHSAWPMFAGVIGYIGQWFSKPLFEAPRRMPRTDR